MVKMSVTDKKLTSDFIESYKRKNPQLKRPDLRKMIRLELGITNDKSALRNLDRQLKDLFDSERRQLKIIEKLKNELHRYEWVAKYLHLSELLDTEEDYQMLYELIEKLEMKKNQESLDEQQKFQYEKSKEIDQDKKSKLG